MTITKPAIKLIGISLGYKTTNENEKAMEDCGALWQQFGGSFIASKISGKLNNNIYAVYYDYDGDYTQPYAYFIGCPVTENTAVPTGMESIMIPEQQYEIVIAKGQMPDCIANAWRDIWKKDDANRAYGYDFEIYSEKSQDLNNAEVDIYISMK